MGFVRHRFHCIMSAVKQGCQAFSGGKESSESCHTICWSVMATTLGPLPEAVFSERDSRSLKKKKEDGKRINVCTVRVNKNLWP